MEERFELSTDRLILRPDEDLDAEFMLALNSDSVAPASPPESDREAIRGERRTETTSALLTLDSALALVHQLQRQFREHRMGRFIVLNRHTRERLGWCGLKPIEGSAETADLGYRLLRRCWGQGFATEAVQACVRYGFEDLQLRTLAAEVETGNQRSIRVLTKLGFGPSGKVEGETATWVLEKPPALVVDDQR